MKYFLICIVLAVFSSRIEGAWHQVWEDDFNGTTLDESKWTYDQGCDGFGNNELECYTAHRHENVRLENGNLVINSRVEEMNGKHFTSGKLHSKQSWTYGKFEARAKLPKGKHLWPAIWMMPAKSVYGGWAASGEIDIMEYRGERTDTLLGTIHFGGSWPNNRASGSGEVKFGSDFSADFHTYGFEWNENEMQWLLDGKVWHKENIHRNFYSGVGNNPYTKPGQPFDQSFYWILNVAIGGNFFPANPFGPQVTPEEARHWAKPTMEVDYVRVWEWK